MCLQPQSVILQFSIVQALQETQTTDRKHTAQTEGAFHTLKLCFGMGKEPEKTEPAFV